MSDKNGEEKRLTSYITDKAMNIFDLKTTLELISKGFPLRTFSEEFKRLIAKKASEFDIPHDELTKKLKSDVGAQNFSNWWNGLSKSGRPITINKENAIKIAFSLKMTVDETQTFLTHSCWHNGFYMRDYKDLIYVFFLDKQLSYADAIMMINKYAFLDKSNHDVEQAEPLDFLPGYERITDKIQKHFEKNVATVEDLGDFLKRFTVYFGSFRRKAHEKLIKMYNLIKNTNDLETTTDNEIIESVMLNIPSPKGKSMVTNEILAKLTENTRWLGLSEIINKSEVKGSVAQVKREHLILFWLYLYGGNPELNDTSEAHSAFEECMLIINHKLLEECGMPILDARNPFDWLIINALYYCHFASDDMDAVERIGEIMDALFSERDEDG